MVVLHLLRLRNLGIVLCWVPSHCGIYWNDYVDKLAKRGANNQYPSKICHSSISYNEFKTRIKTNFKSKTKDAISPLYLPRRISTLLLHLHENVEGLYFHFSLSVCLSLCVCVSSSFLVNKIPAERRHQFGCGFR